MGIMYMPKGESLMALGSTLVTHGYYKYWYLK